LAVGPRLALGFTRGRFTRLAIAARTALAAQIVVGSAQVVVSDIRQFVVNSALSKARRTAEVHDSMLSAMATRPARIRLIHDGVDNVITIADTPE
jgi:hypothetical protein